MTGPHAGMPHDDEALLAQDVARADVYAIIGRLFYAPPDASLLEAISQSGGEQVDERAPLRDAWRDLRRACGDADPAAIPSEFDNLFGGVGKCEVSPFASHYVKAWPAEHHLVRLRGLLESRGLARRSAAGDTEDHVSGICDVMRHLIVDSRPVEEQYLFFNDFVHSGLLPFCEAILRSVNASFYRCVAQFALTFLAIEKAAFDMRDV